MRLSKEKRAELKALAEKDCAKTLDYLAWEGYGLASRQAIPDALADIEELEAALTDYIHSTGIGSTLLPDVVPPERAMLNGCGPDATTVLTLPHSQTPEGVIEALESKLADAVKALEKYGKHPDSCPKGVGIGYYKPPDDAKCNCGIDASITVKP